MTYEQVEEASQYLLARVGRPPEAALVLGSGLSGLEALVPEGSPIDHDEIPHFPASTVAGHRGQLLFGAIGGIDVLILSGRVHYYEGYGMDELTFPIRVLGQMGTKELLLTNAAGSINPDFGVGELMLISDHINLVGVNPLRGKNEDRWGPQFLDQTAVYDVALRRWLRQAASEEDVTLQEGVYVAVSGPSYETPAEIRFFRTIGADAVGMSTVPEAIVARHMGMRVAGISVLSNAAAHPSGKLLNHAEVLVAGRNAQEGLGRILERFYRRHQETD